MFEVINHARNAYDVIKRKCQPKTAAEMWELWIADVLARKAEKAKLTGSRACTDHTERRLTQQAARGRMTVVRADPACSSHCYCALHNWVSRCTQN